MSDIFAILAAEEDDDELRRRYQQARSAATPQTPVVPPLFASAEIGTVDASTIAVTFDQNITASNYAAGVTIKVNTVAATISSAARQTDHAVVYYVLSTPAVASDTVTWEYTGGNITAEDDGAALGTVTAQNVTNNIPEGDPIGDAIRADLLAYWTFNETAGNTRLDSTAANIDLSEAADGTPPPNAPISSMAGKIGNAVKIFDNTSSEDILANNSINITVPIFMTIFGWFKVSAFNGDTQGFNSVILTTASFHSLISLVVVRRENGTMYATSQRYSFDPGLPDISADTWSFCLAEFDCIADTVTLSINNGAGADVPATGHIAPILSDGSFSVIQVGFANYVSDTDWMMLDEWGFVSRQLTSDEKNYLYNSGDGRTLYP